MSDQNEPLDGKNSLPQPYEEEVPELDIRPDLGVFRPEEYKLCPECGKMALDPDINWCRECGYDEFGHDPDVPPTEEEVERNRKEFEKTIARLEARRGRCDALNPACENFAVIECTYPMYDEYNGKYLGDHAAKWCVPHYHEFHQEHGYNWVYGIKAKKIAYL